jgi:hypothetical protein
MWENSRQMLQLPGNHIAFAFSDPAGANACMAMAKLSAAFYHQSSVLFSNKKYDATIDGSVQMVDSAPSFHALEAGCLFTGTSHPQSSGYFEVKCIQIAKNEGLKTISFIDHWVNFRLRFLNEENSPVYPDEVWVVDEEAKRLAINEGLPGEKLVVSGNPYHEYLKVLWKPSFEARSYLEHIGLQTDRTTILFAPDPLSLRDGKEKLGFTEDEALLQILDAISKLAQPVQLVIKCHPLQPVEVFTKLLDNSKVKINLVTAADTLELLHASDVVIGFFSNILLEAEALGKKVIRFFPGKESADLLKHKTSLPAVKDVEQLMATLKHCIND